MKASAHGSTTFILGAGASFHAGYPLIASMGKELFAWMRQPRTPVSYGFAEYADDLERRFGDNIESVLQGIDDEIRRHGPDRPAFANCHRPAVAEAMRQWFVEIHRGTHASAYQQFAAEIVQSGDTIITFNYDVGIGGSLRAVGKWHIGDVYGFPAKTTPVRFDRTRAQIAWDINWFAILFQGRTDFS